MAILVLLVLMWTPYVLSKLHVLRARTRAGGPPQTAGTAPAGTAPAGGAQTHAGSADWPAWSALDDRQLTRLLTDSAPRTITE